MLRLKSRKKDGHSLSHARNARLRLSKNPSGRFGGPKPSKCNPHPATCAADAEALPCKVSLRCFPPGSPAGTRGKRRKARKRTPQADFFDTLRRAFLIACKECPSLSIKGAPGPMAPLLCALRRNLQTRHHFPPCARTVRVRRYRRLPRSRRARPWAAPSPPRRSAPGC